MAEEPTDTKAHEEGETSVFEAEEQKSPKTIAKDYMLPMSDAALEEWQDKEGFAEYCAQVASGLYPTLAPQLAMGLTTKALLDPYEQLAKKYLGPFSEAELDSPMWQKVLSGGTDPKTGKPTVMPLADFVSFIKSHAGSGYLNTNEGQARVGNSVNQLRQNPHAWDGTPEHKAVLMRDISNGAHPGGVHPSNLPPVVGED
jgi:hypothetical protein